MSRLNSTFKSIVRLSVPAAEEAHRFGHPAVDVEHVFLALLISQTPAGRLLRSHGISLDQARVAVQEQHTERIGRLGIPEMTVPPRPIPADGLGEINWNDRVMEMLSRSAHDASGLTLLRALITDGGGFIAGMLARLGTSGAALLSALEQPNVTTATTPDLPPDPPIAGMKEHSQESFVPAPVDQVWELLDTPERRPEWDSTIDSIEPGGEKQWIGHAVNDRIRTPRAGRVRVFTLTRREERRLLEWEQHLPLLRRHRPSRLLIRLDEQPGGTRLRLIMRRHRPVFPLPRFFFTIELSAYANGVSRALRP